MQQVTDMASSSERPTVAAGGGAMLRRRPNHRHAASATIESSTEIASFDETTLARIGALVGDPGRASMLAALLDGRALTAAELAAHAGVTPQTASGYLAKFVSTGIVT